MKYKSALKAIKAKCLDCCCFNSNEVRLCEAKDCPLWEYRSGHNPKKPVDPNKPKKQISEGLRKYLDEQKRKREQNAKTNTEVLPNEKV